MDHPIEPLLSRRQLLQGAVAAACSVGALGSLACSGARDGRAVPGRRTARDLQPHAPIACAMRAARNRAGGEGGARFAYQYSKYSGWPEIKESLMAGRIQAAYMLAPLVMDLADKQIPVKIVSLGHRSGAVIMVRTDSPYQHFRRARGQGDRDPEPVRGRLPVPAQDARAGGHDAGRDRARRDARRPTCRPRSTPTPSTPTARASRSARRRSARAMRGRSA